MPTAGNALIQYEAGQSVVAMVELSDDGDHKIYNSADALWSDRSGYEPDVKPNGLVSGGKVTPESSSTNDQVDVAALVCYLAGVSTEVGAAADNAITRGTTKEMTIHSVTVTAAGAIAIVDGTEGDSLVETRDAAGGPPLIAVDAIEIAQIRVTTKAAAAVKASEIFEVVGTHRERYDFPTWEIDHARVADQVIGLAGITLNSALPLIHTGSVSKKVFASYNEPQFAEIPNSSDFVPPETAHSVSSTEIYGSVRGATSKSLAQGSFTAHLRDGISDGLLTLKDEKLWFKFKQDRLKNPYILTHGTLGIKRTFPAGASIVAACTVSAEKTSAEVTG